MRGTGKNVKDGLLGLTMLFVSFVGYGQCTMLPASTICGDINPGITVITPSPACFRSSVTMHLTSDIFVDSICLTFGDGQDTLLLSPDTAFDITHNYNFPPPDDCPGGDPYPGIQCIIQANFYKHCPGNGFSFNFKSTALSFRFKPRVKFPYHAVALCNGNCLSVPLDSSCTNTYWQTDSTSYIWSFGDTSLPDTFLHTPLSTYVNPGHCYSSPGTYLMILSAENGCGAEADTVKVVVQRIDSLVIPQLTHLCTGAPVNVNLVTENSSALNTFIAPGPPDDTVINPATANPQIIFKTPGTYIIYFTSGACYVDTTVTVESSSVMLNSGVADTCFSGSNVLVLSNYYSTPSALQVNSFKVSDTAGVLYYSSATGVPSTPVSLPHAGRYFVADTSFTTCDTLVLPIDTFNIIPSMHINLPADTFVCLQTLFVLPSFTGVTITRNGSVVNNDTFYIDSLISYNFTYTPACGNSFNYTVTAKGIAAEAKDSSYCAAPGVIILTATPAGGIFGGQYVTGNQFNGNTAGSGNHIYTYTFDDVASGCVYVDTGYINIYPPMQVAFTLSDTVCAGAPAVFVNHDSAQTNAVNFGDGTGNFAGDSIAHIYTTAGLQQVTIRVTDTLGCSVVYADSVRVLPLPVATFTLPGSVCDSTTVTPVMLANINPQYTYEWVFNGDTTATAPTILLRDTLYNIVNYYLSLTVTSPQCGSVTQTDSVQTLPQTRTGFGLIYNANCSPMHLQFANNARGDSLSYKWYLNGVFLSQDSVPPAMELTADSVDSTYRFKLVICSASCGCDSSTQSVTVHPVNFAVCFRPDSFSVCQGQRVKFTDCSRNYCSLVYNFGDGQDTIAQSGETVGHTYSQPGTYTVWLTITCNCQTDSASQQVVIKPAPAVTPVITNAGCTGQIASFDASVTSGAAVFYKWSFGDSTYSTQQNTAHNYTSGGNYTGWLYAVGADFCASDTQFFSIPVTQSPSSTFYMDTSVCQRVPLQIMVDTPLNNTTYIWHVVQGGDSELVTSTTGAFYFNTADTGTFAVWLNAVDNTEPQCNTKSSAMRVTVMPAPVAKFSENPVESVVSAPFNFFNQSTGGLSYWWAFGDGDSLYAVNPVHVYQSPGQYNITLIAYNNLCSDTTYNHVLVSPVLNIFIPNTIIPNGTGYNDYFRIFGETEAIENLQVRIFDRTGEEVFSSNDIQFKWDGTYKGKPVGPAVFTYMITINVVGGEQKPPRVYKGSITVLR